MAVPMLLESRYRLVLVCAAAAALVVLLAALLLGFLGPDTTQGTTDYAYHCQDDSHEWNSTTCTGVRMGLPTSPAYHYNLPALDRWNGFWTVLVHPFPRGNDTVREVLYLETTVLARDSEEEAWEVVQEASTSEEVLECNAGSEVCAGFPLVYVSSIRHAFYRIAVTLPSMADGENASAKEAIGDMGFEYQWYDPDFTKEKMLLRVTFVVLSLAAGFVFYVRARLFLFSTWSFDQKLMLPLFVALILYNDPLYPLVYLVPGSSFVFVDTLFQVLWQCVLVLYWLVEFDYIRQAQEKYQWSKWDVVKAVFVAIYGFIAYGFFVWFRIANGANPVYGKEDGTWMLSLMFLFSGMAFGIVIVAAVGMVLAAVPQVARHRRLMSRFAASGSLSAFVMFSGFVGLLFGAFGPVQRTAPATIYYLVLNNLYVYLLALAYWPVKSPTPSMPSAPTEVSPIFRPDEDVFGTGEGKDSAYIQDEDL